MTGEQLKAEGCDLVAEHNQDWSEWAVDEIVRLAKLLSYTGITADDLYSSMHIAGRTHCHPNAIGAAFRTAANAGFIKLKGYKRSRRASNHARVLTVWTVP